MPKEKSETPPREHLSYLEGIEQLRPLFAAVDQHQRDIGLILWKMDPSPGELVKLAEEFGYSVDTLKSWMRTANRIRNMPTGLAFGVQMEFARIDDEDARIKLLESRPAQEWTIYSAKAAVEEYFRRNGPGAGRHPVVPKAKSASRARYDDSREAKATLTLRQETLLIEIESTRELGEPQISGNGRVRRIEFSW